MGLLVATNGLNPLLQAKAIYENRKRVLFSGALLAAGFTLFMTAFILATVDIALQWEVQGFIVFESILAAAAGFAGLAIICLVMAKLIFPKPKANLGEFNFAPLIESLIKSLELATQQTRGSTTEGEHEPEKSYPQEPQSQEPLRASRDDFIERQVGLAH